MDYVRIRGKSIQDCFMKMKMKYGPEAQVLDQRIVTEKGIMGTSMLAKKHYEIDVGIPEQKTSKDKVEKKLQDLKELLKVKSEETTQPVKTLDGFKPLETGNRVKVDRQENNRPIPIETSDDSNNKREIETIESTSSIKEPVLGISFQEEMTRERTPKKSLDTNSDSIHIQRLIQRLQDEGLSRSYLEEFQDRLDKNLSFIERSRSSAVLDKAQELLEEKIMVRSDLLYGAQRGKRKVVILIGPTGGGKTTTIAKLAAKYSLHLGKTVSLYTADNYRIAAIEQLKRYADTMDMPFFAIKDKRGFQEALLRDGSELILIDTAGFSHKNQEFYSRLTGLSEFFGEKDSLEFMLVLPSVLSYANARAVMRSYEDFSYSRIILTKTDESDFIGQFVELADMYSKEFSYLSIGQGVPFDILPAEKNMLAELTLFPEKIKELKGEAFAGVH